MLDRRGKYHINSWVGECAVDWVASAIYNEMDLIEGEFNTRVLLISHPRCCLAGVSIRLCIRHHQEPHSFVETLRVPYRSRFKGICDGLLVWAKKNGDYDAKGLSAPCPHRNHAKTRMPSIKNSIGTTFTQLRMWIITHVARS